MNRTRFDVASYAPTSPLAVYAERYTYLKPPILRTKTDERTATRASAFQPLKTRLVIKFSPMAL